MLNFIFFDLLERVTFLCHIKNKYFETTTFHAISILVNEYLNVALIYKYMVKS